jgi:hypothetical protein
MAFGVRMMKHIQLEPARIMSYKSNQIISDSLEAKIEAKPGRNIIGLSDVWRSCT